MILESTYAAAPVPVERPTPHIPAATYRLQFNHSFTFHEAIRRVAYLHQLGISDCYASPYFKARRDSSHGYDIANHNELNPAIGDEQAYSAFVAELHAHGMGQIIDVVPNHMGIGEPENIWWQDVLENGPSSLYATYFDIDWHPIKRELENKVLLPILGQQYGRVLENGELKLRYEDGAFYLNYYEHELPINPRTYIDVLVSELDNLIAQLGDEHDYILEYQSILTGLDHLPPRTETDRPKVIERAREKEILKRRLATLCGTSPEIRAAIDRGVARFNGSVGQPRSFDLLDALIDRQAYRLSYWRIAAEEINYRRFFDINELAAIRMELPDVFEDTQRLLLRLLAEGKVNGLRIDHPDGLWDPAAYFRRLQECYAELHSQQMSDEPAKLTSADNDKQLYIVVEKILGRGERLPADWAVHGTTGYEFLNALNGIFIDTSAEKRFTDLYTAFTGERQRLDDLVYRSKKQIMDISMASELSVLAYQLAHISEKNRYYRDFTLNSQRDALREVIACFPVYRTYINADTNHVEDRDRTYIEAAIAAARRRNPAIDPSIYEFLRDILLLRYPDTFEEDEREKQRDFAMHFQQLTGPVMAKGLEDTSFYIYNRLVSLNEVGGEPKRFGLSASEFHRLNRERLRSWPASMLTTSTHDTKRSEDVRARINVLSEIPDEWRAAVMRWSRLNRSKKISVDEKLAPDRNEEYMLYQTLLGAWPFELPAQGSGAADTNPAASSEWSVFVERIQNYMIKAIREAKVNTSWLNTNTAYDDAVRRFVGAILENRPSNRFLTYFRAFQQQVAHFGAFNALSQTLLKLTSPGMPDIYQGTDMWDFSLVDPDNRRPVDYDLRAWLLGELVDWPESRPKLARMLLDYKHDGRIKLYLIHRTLTFRREHSTLFQAGSYRPLDAGGDAAEHIVAFARILGSEEAIVVAPRLLAKRLHDANKQPIGKAAWGTALLALPATAAGNTYRNIFTDEIVTPIERDGVLGLPLALVLANFPVALLERVIEPEPEPEL